MSGDKISDRNHFKGARTIYLKVLEASFRRAGVDGRINGGEAYGGVSLGIGTECEARTRDQVVSFKCLLLVSCFYQPSRSKGSFLNLLNHEHVGNVPDSNHNNSQLS